MKRYDLNNECQGESGECRAELVRTVDGDWVSFDDAERMEQERDALRIALHRCAKLSGCEVSNDVSDAVLCSTVPDEIRRFVQALRDTRSGAIGELNAFADVLYKHCPSARNMSKPPWLLIDELIAGLKAERDALAARIAEIEKGAWGWVHEGDEDSTHACFDDWFECAVSDPMCNWSDGAIVEWERICRLPSERYRIRRHEDADGCVSYTYEKEADRG